MIKYKNVNSFNDLLNLNISFIKGEIDKTIYHLGPLDKETDEIKKEILEINQKGLLTTQSQPGGLNFIGYRQRPYLKFFINKNTENFNKIKNFLLSNDLYFYRIFNIHNSETIKNFDCDLIITKEINSNEPFTVINESDNEFESFPDIINKDFYIIEIIYSKYQNFNIFQELLMILN